METPAPQWPSPDAVTVMRDDAAQREQAVIDAIATAAGAGTPQAVVIAEIEGAAAPQRLEALGGLYIAYPDSSPTPVASAVPTDVVAAVTAARDGHLADALVAQDADLASLLTAAGLSHALSSWFAIWVDDQVAGETQPVVEERLLSTPVIPEPSLLPAEGSTTDEETLSELGLAHDQARYAYEVLAARAAEDEREQWLARRALQDARAQSLVDLPGVEDQRAAVYVLSPEQSGDSAQRVATAIEIENRLGAAYAALAATAGAGEKPWLLGAAFDAYAQAAAFGEPTDSPYPVPALPGIESVGSD
ncbi:hypothetical protein Dac01nite_09640 [Demequina activiva]|uniref:Uncharacterized protein n=2 Tax=Demequina activiva TaxID=1582364 RepID=A0A919Q2T5_9MICO|nr:hypothetical protein Dac01nite_09640 [Demequina activiva]